ncbi:MAG: cytochrome c biogenesis protein CcsA [Bacteroidales bacterium]
MKKVLAFFSSTGTMAFLMVVFAVSLALATFIENDFGSQTARSIIYNAKWFEILLFSGGINIILLAFKRKTYKKPAIFIFHLAFVIILAGAAATRYLGFEGTMKIREGNETSIFYTSDNYITIEAQFGEHYKSVSKAVILNPLSKRNYNHTIKITDKIVTVRLLSYNPNIIANSNSGGAVEELVFRITSGSATETFSYRRIKDSVGETEIRTINDVIVKVRYGIQKAELPFSLRLNDFVLERYPGSKSPSGYESRVVIVEDNELFPEFSIYMNHVLKHKGYRFYQASYDEDEKGTILSVNYDRTGTNITYAGYLLMGIGMFFSMFSKRSRFRFLLNNSGRIQKSKKAIALSVAFLAILPACALANQFDIPNTDKKHAKSFGTLLVQDHDGRIKPLNTLNSEVLRKIARKNEFRGLTPDEVVLSMLVYPEQWQKVPFIKVGHRQINDILGINGKLVTFDAFFNDSTGGYLLREHVKLANMKKPGSRSKFDTEVIRADERLNVFYMTCSGAMLNIFPKEGDPDHTWYNPTHSASGFNSEDSVFVRHILPYYIGKVHESVKSNDWKESNDLLNAIKAFQYEYGGEIIPSDYKIKLELLYNQYNPLARLSGIYGFTGFVLLIMHFIAVFYTKLKTKWLLRISTLIVFLAFTLHAFGLAARWYISGHAPWSNGYEALTYIAWTAVLAGIVFSFKSPIALSTSSILAWLILSTAHLSWMDPEITNLVPVLKSYWLIIHVAVITASYGFLGMAALLAAVNLVIMIFQNLNNKKRTDLTINELSTIIELALIIGLYLLAAGTFLGAIWANESWGRYWGWDPKETWSLITIMVYAFITHMRLVPGLKSQYGFNLMSLLGFSAVIMTYFGVNYYLSGLHSYAQGDTIPVPAFVYYTLLIIAVVASLAYTRQYMLARSVKDPSD